MTFRRVVSPYTLWAPYPPGGNRVSLSDAEIPRAARDVFEDDAVRAVHGPACGAVLDGEGMCLVVLSQAP
jgi:hypothetical protein